MSIVKERAKNAEYYCQCKLVRDVAYIPTPIAKIGNIVSVSDKTRDMGAGWEVVFAGKPVPASYVFAAQSAHKRHRKQTDI